MVQEFKRNQDIDNLGAMCKAPSADIQVNSVLDSHSQQKVWSVAAHIR